MTSTSASRRAYESLKRDIMTCRIPPGAPIFEGQIAALMQVSKTPVREALGLLVQEGYVEVRPRQGYRVTEVTVADLHDLFGIRVLLEPAAAELAAEFATASELRKLQDLSKRTYVFGDAATYEQFVADNRAFHVTLAEASGNTRLTVVLRGLLEQMQRLFFLGLDLRDSADEQVAEHQDLVDALLKGNHHLARQVAERQVETSRQRVMEALLASASGAATSRTAPAAEVGTGKAAPPDAMTLAANLGAASRGRRPTADDEEGVSLTPPAMAEPAPESVTTRTYHEIKNRILTCAIAPGAYLTEGRLAELLSVSRAPVREALAMLVHEGFVHAQSRHGYLVREITLGDVQEILYLRLLLEPAAAALAAQRATGPQLRTLTELAAQAARGGPAFRETDRRFQGALAEASGNRRLAAILKHLIDEVHRLHMAGLDTDGAKGQGQGRHQDLVRALLRGNHHLAHDIAMERVETDRVLVMSALLDAFATGNGTSLRIGGSRPANAWATADAGD